MLPIAVRLVKHSIGFIQGVKSKMRIKPVSSFLITKFKHWLIQYKGIVATAYEILNRMEIIIGCCKSFIQVIAFHFSAITTWIISNINLNVPLNPTESNLQLNFGIFYT